MFLQIIVMDEECSEIMYGKVTFHNCLTLKGPKMLTTVCINQVNFLLILFYHFKVLVHNFSLPPVCSTAYL